VSQLGPPLRGGINDRFVDTEDALPPKYEWERLARMRAQIGQCRRLGCDAPLRAIPADEHDHSGEDGAISWYEAVCDNGHEVAAPNGRVLRKSSLHGEMPSSWWEQREARDKKLREETEA
jgi:hypothetical protein